MVQPLFNRTLLPFLGITECKIPNQWLARTKKHRQIPSQALDRFHMKLEQGQIWQQGDAYYRIVEWSRLAIDYKAIKDLNSREGTRHQVTKKEFCRLIKGGRLLMPDDLMAPTPPEDEVIG